ncbi:MAG TPA: MoaD/ThiS family protein [Egibacteraceae bacterium]|nr:MoaD/ThiS family protein [Egibacteraceae bacterium]
MAVRVRLFAALREAAGTSETTASPGPLPTVLDELRARYDERFAARLAVCAVLVDGNPTPLDAPVDVPDGGEVALLPPFSGGARREPSGWLDTASAPGVCSSLRDGPSRNRFV